MDDKEQKFKTYRSLSDMHRFRLRLFAEGILTGIFAGIVISFFRFALSEMEYLRGALYNRLWVSDWSINACWFAVLIAIAFILHKLNCIEPMAAGSGIPQVKGAILGLMKMRWLHILWVKLTAGIIGIGAGLSLGREGPSIQLGAVAAQGVSRLMGRTRMEERYLRELVSVSGDSSTRLLTIYAYGADEATANKILDALLVRMEDVRPTIQSTVGSHSIAQLTRTSTVSVMTWLRDSQQQNRDDLTNLQNQVTTLEAADRVLEQSIEDEQQALEAMELPKKPKETGNSMAKMVILGALLGGVLACGVVVVRFLLDGMVYSASELNRSTGLPVLGALASDRTKKAGKLDAKLYQMEGRPDGSADAEMLCLMAQTICSRAPEAKNILVTGDLPADQLEALAAALQATEPLRGQSVTAAESILKAAATVPHVVAADAIVLAADCTVTRTDAVREQNEKIVRLGKQILGCIVYE